MKNKTKTYLLLGSVLIIWGLIGYRILSAVAPDTPEVSAQQLSINFKPKAAVKSDTFSIQTVARDPFLGTLQSQGKKTSIKKNQTPKPEFSWPNVIYHGIVKEKDSNSERIFIVSVNGKQRLLKRGKTFNDVLIVKGKTKELTVKYKGKLKTISLKQ